MAYTVLGASDEITVCDCCGRSNLKVTVALENTETGKVVHFGRDCAGAAVFGRKTAKNAANVADEARALDVYRHALAATGCAKKAGSWVFQKTGRTIHQGMDGITRMTVDRAGKVVTVVVAV